MAADWNSDIVRLSTLPLQKQRLSNLAAVHNSHIEPAAKSNANLTHVWQPDPI